MRRYIDADKLQEEFKELHGGKRSLLIDAQPTADVRENVKGEWLHISDGYCDILKCSQCGKTTDSQSNYCPNCGCLMKGEDE